MSRLRLQGKRCCLDRGPWPPVEVLRAKSGEFWIAQRCIYCHLAMGLDLRYCYMRFHPVTREAVLVGEVFVKIARQQDMS